MAKANVVNIALGDVTSTCFVMMPFAGTFQLMYERVIRPAIIDAGLRCVRGDEVFTTPQITHEIWRQIRTSTLVLAELTGKNPNVLYELGLAHALGKPSIIITRDEADVPFDLRALRYRYYDTGNPYWGEDLKTALTEMCKSVMAQPNYLPVLDGISSSESIAIHTLPPAPPPSLPRYDLTGIWEGKARFGASEYIWSLHLGQKESALVATAMISVQTVKDLFVVEQNMSGSITDDRVTLSGTSYSFLRAGDTLAWYLEDITATVADAGRTIKGTIKGSAEGEIELRRKTT